MTNCQNQNGSGYNTAFDVLFRTEMVAAARFFYPGLYLALSLCRKNPVKGLDCFEVGRHVRRRVPPDIRVTAYFRSKQMDLLWGE